MELNQQSSLINQTLKQVSFSHLAEELSDGVVLTSPYLQQPNPQIVYVNRNLLKLTGYQLEELIGQSPRIFQGEKTNRTMLAQLRESLIAESSFTGETVNYRKDGSPYEVQLTVTPIKDENGKLLYFMGIQRDMSAHREAERSYLEAERLRLALQAEKELNHMKADFIHHFTEQIRQPLTMIRVAAELLDRYGTQISAERQHSRLRLIMNEVDYLATTLDDIRMASSGFDEKPILRLQAIEIEQVLKNIIKSSEEQYPQRRFFIEKDMFFPIELRLDGRLLRIVLHHLLNNAAKFSPPQSEIRICLHATRETITIVISDKGIGIPEESREHLFKHYYRAPNASSYKGIGLGLVIVKRNVENMGGTIELESREKEGTTVRISLPRNLA